MTSPQTLTPADFRGFGRGAGIYGGLLNDDFVSVCPPDVQPTTRIIAVCGVSDTKGDADPKKDGWFFSDFFLYHYLLRDSSKFISGNQIWLTCANPRSLVTNYKEYVHGQHKGGDRRVVLDDTMLDDLEKSGTIRVVHCMQLLERFVSTVKDEIKIAAELNQPVLILVFGHGDSDHHGIAIGGDFQRSAPRLKMREFEKVLKKDVDVTLMLTSCYSGGWVTKPIVRESIHPLQASRPLNITAMTAAGAEEMSWAWATSQSIGQRAGGSIFATAVMNALMNTSHKTPGFAHMCEAFDAVVNETEDGESIRYEPTYVNLVKTVYETMQDLDPFFPVAETHGITFAAKDDKWDLGWRKRTGFPLVNYQSRWQTLKPAPSRPEIYHPDGTLLEAPENKTGGGGGQFNILRERAFAYMNSFPGALNAGSDMSFHADLRALINGTQEFEPMTLAYLESVLEYRNAQLNLATDFAHLADLKMEEAKKFDVQNWLQVNNAARKGSHLEAASIARELLAKYNQIRSMIFQKKLFGIPVSQIQGPGYAKPKEYLAIGFALTSLTKAEVEERIDRLHKLNNAKEYIMASMHNGKCIMEDGRVFRARSTLKKTLGRVGLRLRSLSPSKRRLIVEPGNR